MQLHKEHQREIPIRQTRRRSERLGCKTPLCPRKRGSEVIFKIASLSLREIDQERKRRGKSWQSLEDSEQPEPGPRWSKGNILKSPPKILLYHAENRIVSDLYRIMLLEAMTNLSIEGIIVTNSAQLSI